MGAPFRGTTQRDISNNDFFRKQMENQHLMLRNPDVIQLLKLARHVCIKQALRHRACDALLDGGTNQPMGVAAGSLPSTPPTEPN